MKEHEDRWKSLKCWGADAVKLEKLAGGHANDVWSVRVNGTIAVGRLGKRSDDDLKWETDLLQFLHQNGLSVPLPIPTTDGKLFVNGLVVMTFVEGRAPETKNDWQRVASTLSKLHQLTNGWPQRPGWKSSIDLIDADKGTKVDLKEMPAEAVERCRNAWRPFQQHQKCVIHGDPNSRNILISGDRVTLIDWDESHLDVRELDLVLPFNAGNLSKETFDLASQASAAWEAAVCWDDDYARSRLKEVR